MSASRLAAMDYLRAVFSLCVVAVHLGHVLPSSIFDKDTFTAHVLTPSDIVNFYGLLLAVPVFFAISSYLFALKPYDWRGLGKQLVRASKLLVFWGLLLNVVRYYPRLLNADWLPADATSYVLYLFRGFNTVYYFFASLLLVTLATHFAKRWSTTWLVLAFGLSTALVAVMPLVSIRTGVFELCSYWNPVNFLPYPFAATLIKRFHEANPGWAVRLLVMGGLATAAVGTALLDWTIYVDAGFFTVNEYAVPTYTRPSLVFLATLLLLLTVHSWPRENRVIAFMARHSLALYCLHPFFVPWKTKMVSKLNLAEGWDLLVPLVLIVLVCYVCSLLLPLFLQKDLVR